MPKSRFVVLSVCVDALLVNAGIVLAFVIRFQGQLPSFNFAAYVALAPVLTLVYLGAFYVFGLYEPERTENPWTVARSVSFAVGLGTLTTAAVSFFAGLFSFSRLVIVMAAAAHLVLLVGWRLAALRLTPIRWPEQRVLIVGTRGPARELARELGARSKWGYTLVGMIELEGGGDEAVDVDGVEVAVLGTTRQLPSLVAAHRVSRVIVTSAAAHREIVEELALADETDIHIDVIPDLYEIFIGQVDQVVSDIPLMELTKGPVPSWFSNTKRLIDMAGAVVLLVLSSPVVVLAIVAVLVSMGRPVFFTQERVGKGLKPFRVVKLRTMVRGAEEESGPVLATEDDERITPVGRFLRRYRIDEIPQLVNILKGDMSFVGPRPERPFFVDGFLEEIPGYRERFKVKPGATGLAQVSGSYATTPERKLKYDLIYMYHQSLLMDVQILAQTVRVVLTGKGAR